MLGPRRLDEEVMDRPWDDLGALRSTLARVAAVNDRLGGTRALRKALRRHAGPLAGLRLLDVGTGDASLPLRISQWAREEGGDCSVVGLDPHPQIAWIARAKVRGHRGLTIVRGDGRRLPFRDRAFDAAVSTLTLHHLDDEGARLTVSEMARVSRELVLVNDLERSLANLVGARILAATAWRNDPVVRHDGPLSVLRSFTRAELLEIGRDAGLEAARVTRYAPYRLVLSGRPS